MTRNHCATATLCITTLAIVVMVVQRCRRCPDLSAHFPVPCNMCIERCPDKCDPRTDELQAWASYYEREDCV